MYYKGVIINNGAILGWGRGRLNARRVWSAMMNRNCQLVNLNLQYIGDE